MSQNRTPEQNLIRGALLPSLVVGLLGIVGASLARGKAGLLAAMLAQIVVVMYFTVHLLVSSSLEIWTR